MPTDQAQSRRIVGVEEHFLLPDMLRRIPPEAAKARGYFSRDQPYAGFSQIAHLVEVGEERLGALDEAGVSVQVLSLDGPGTDLLPPRDGAAWAREANDALAGLIAVHPDRFAGLAHLPLTDPDAAADELERCVRQLGLKGALVRGSTDGRYLDHPSYDVLLARAARRWASPCTSIRASRLRPCARPTTAACPSRSASGCRSQAGGGTPTPPCTSCG